MDPNPTPARASAELENIIQATRPRRRVPVTMTARKAKYIRELLSPGTPGRKLLKKNLQKRKAKGLRRAS